MSASPQVADGACLFVLEQSGVFFSEAHQELHVFNAPATFVWCAVEEGYPAGQIVSAYASAFEMAPAEAERHVAELLHRWRGLGWLANAGDLAPPRIHLNTALGRLLCNEGLRRDFARDARGTARALGLGGEDVDALLSIDPEQLALQASTVTGKRSARRRRSLARRPRAAEAACQTPHASSVRRYRMLGTTLAIHYGTPAAECAVHPPLAHLETLEPARDEVCTVIEERAAHHDIHRDGARVAEGRALEQLAPVIKALLRQVALERASYWMEIHAGVVGLGERCVVLPAPPGSGKTTLTGALVAAGCEYFSDEVALLESETLAVRPVPLALTVKPGAVDVLAPWFPELRDLPVHRRQDEQWVRYLDPFARDGGPVPTKSRAIGWLVFPRYTPERPTALEPLDRATALKDLLQECVVLPELLDREKVRRLVQWIRGVDCYALSMASAGEAVACIRSLCD